MLAWHPRNGLFILVYWLLCLDLQPFTCPYFHGHSLHSVSGCEYKWRVRALAAVNAFQCPQLVPAQFLILASTSRLQLLGRIIGIFNRLGKPRCRTAGTDIQEEGLCQRCQQNNAA